VPGSGKLHLDSPPQILAGTGVNGHGECATM
jgi:hypothetical protein